MPELSTIVSSRIFYRKMGVGPVMVLLHGFPETGELWHNIWDALSVSFTLIIPDLPGSGASRLEKETSISMMAETVKAILDKEEINSAILAGHSMGGYVALAFAGLYPAMVEGVSLVHSMPVADDDEKKKARIKSVELIEKGGKEPFIRQMIPNLFSDVFKQNNPAIVKEHIDKGLKMNSDSLINFYNAMRLREDRRNMVKAAKFPIQWIIGLGDNIMGYKKILIESHQSAINFVTFYHECGHMSMIEAPGKLTADLETFGKYSHHFFHAGV